MLKRTNTFHRKPSAAELNDSARAQLFTQFSTLERSGIPLLQSVPIISKQSPQAFQPKLQQLQRWLQAGNALAEAGRRSGLFLSWERRVIAAAEAAGGLQTIFERLAEHYRERAQRFKKLKTRMLYPYAVLVIGMLVLPLPALVSGALGPMGYLLRTLLPLVLFFAAIRFLALNYKRALAGEREDFSTAWLFNIPLLRKQLQCELLALLALLLRAGLPALEALQVVQDSAQDIELADQFERAIAAVNKGMNVSEALTVAGLLEHEYAPGLLNSGEFAGRLEQMLDYYVARLREQLQSRLDRLAEWFPRIFYFVIIGLLLLNIF